MARCGRACWAPLLGLHACCHRARTAAHRPCSRACARGGGLSYAAKLLSWQAGCGILLSCWNWQAEGGGGILLCSCCAAARLNAALSLVSVAACQRVSLVSVAACLWSPWQHMLMQQAAARGGACSAPGGMLHLGACCCFWPRTFLRACVCTCVSIVFACVFMCVCMHIRVHSPARIMLQQGAYCCQGNAASKRLILCLVLRMHFTPERGYFRLFTFLFGSEPMRKEVLCPF